MSTLTASLTSLLFPYGSRDKKFGVLKFSFPGKFMSGSQDMP